MALVAVGLVAGASAPPDALASGSKGEVGVGVFLGGGTYKNDDFNRALESHGYGPIDSGVEYGFGADYRCSNWISVAFEVLRVGGDAPAPATPPPSTELSQYSIEAAPLAFDLLAHLVRKPKGNVDAFVGVGPLLSATVRGVQGPFEISARKTGVYAHGGAGVEVRFSPMVGLGARAMARYARANNVDLRAVTGDPNALWDLDFSGVAFSIGPRLYFGSVE